MGHIAMMSILGDSSEEMAVISNVISGKTNAVKNVIHVSCNSLHEVVLTIVHGLNHHTPDGRSFGTNDVIEHMANMKPRHATGSMKVHPATDPGGMVLAEETSSVSLSIIIVPMDVSGMANAHPGNDADISTSLFVRLGLPVASVVLTTKSDVVAMVIRVVA